MSEQSMIGGRYQIQDKLGQGGMGTVYRGLDTQTQQSVAVKRLNPDLSQPEMIERFKREGEALRQLNHPNIIKMLDAVEQDGQHYLVLEYVPGGDLNHLLNGKPLPIERVLAIALELSDALSRAHHLKIIHRDLKPANVLIADDGTPRLTDFGIAHLGKKERVTETGNILGTIDYLAPEALRSDDVDARADLWAFGVMLFEMVSGQRPFQGDKTTQVLVAIMNNPVPDLEVLCPDAPLALVDLIYRMLEKDRNARIPSARQVGAALEAITEHLDTPTPKTHSAPETRRSEIMTRFLEPTPPPEAIKHNLPKQPTPFVGREQEMNDLLKLLADSQTSLVSIVAPGGMGKTRLALAVAEDAVNPASFSPPHVWGGVGGGVMNGVFLVELAPLSSAEHIVPTIADAVGFQFYPGGEPKQELLDYFREKSVLLVLDNFEHLLDGVSIVSDILQTARNIKIIATSRERLNLRGETVFTLGGMDFPDWETPEDALQYSAVKLFMQSARRARPGFELQADDLRYVARICRMVEGLPLGIELAAAWMGMLSPEEVAAELSRGVDFLETDLRDVPERQRSIRAVFDYSWNLLTPEERAVFARIAVFRGGFSRLAGQNVTGASLKQLTALVNKSLVSRNPASGRYHIHELLRQYAEEQLETFGEMERIADAHSDYYLNALAQRERDLEGDKQLEALADIESDIENVRAAWLWAAKHGRLDTLDQSLHSLCLYYEMRGLYSECETALGQAADALRLVAANPQRNEVLGHILARQAIFSITLFQHEKSDRLLDESAALLMPSGSACGRASLAIAQGHSRLTWQKPQIARPYFEEALALYRQIGNRWGIAQSLRTIGASHWYRTDVKHTNLPEATRLLQEALTIQKSMNDSHSVAQTLMNLGVLAIMSNKFEQSLRLSLESLDVRRKMGNKLGIATVFNNVGIVHERLGQFQEARQLYEQSLAVRRELGNIVGIVQVLGNLSGNAFKDGDFAQARAYAEAGLELVESGEHQEWLYDMLFRVGVAQCAEGAYREAERCFRRVYALSEGAGDKQTMGDALNRLGDIALAQRQFEEAGKYLESSLQIAQELENKREVADNWREMGELAYAKADYQQARGYLSAALVLVREEVPQEVSYHVWGDLPVKQSLAVVLISLARVDQTEGDYQTAQRQLHEALAVAQWTASLSLALQAIAGIAELYAAQSQLNRAIELAALVQSHPKAYAISKDQASRLLDTLKTQLPPDVFAIASERGAALELETVIGELLHD